MVFLLAAIMFYSCDEKIPIFIADLSSETIEIQTNLSEEYLLSKETENNIADRIIWNETTLGTNINYQVQMSSDPSFNSFILVGTTSANNYVILVKDFLRLAGDLGLDSDPLTTDIDGNPNNRGTVYLRVKASIGNGGAGSDEIFSEIKSTIITLIEVSEADDSCDPLWLVGDTLQNVGWGWSSPLETTCEAGIHTVKAYFINGVDNGKSFRFFAVFDSWDTNNSYQYYVDQGYAIDSKFIGSQDTDNFVFTGTDGIYVLTLDTNTKEIILTASESFWAIGGATPGGWNLNFNDATELPEISPDLWQTTLDLSNDSFRFFDTSAINAGDWTSVYNYDYFIDLGYSIDNRFESDGGGDSNIVFTGVSGSYVLTINASDKVITLE